MTSIYIHVEAIDTNVYIFIILIIIPPGFQLKKNPGVFVKHECPRRQHSPKFAIFSLDLDLIGCLTSQLTIFQSYM